MCTWFCLGHRPADHLPVYRQIHLNPIGVERPSGRAGRFWGARNPPGYLPLNDSAAHPTSPRTLHHHVIRIAGLPALACTAVAHVDDGGDTSTKLDDPGVLNFSS